ncbi:MAG: peptidase M50 [Candidatus Sumerlaea sp.]|nr:MAG: peptidase M50 [Candidatus Sumerlaea sp.]
MDFRFSPELLLYIPVFLFSLTVHEFAHALTARAAGDMTAAYRGRLTLNPIAHIDPIGTVVLPLLALFSGVPMIGWAKPVPVNELHFRRPIWTVWVALSGPLSNFFLAILFAGVLKLAVHANLLSSLPESFLSILVTLVQTFIVLNVVLGMFNLLPIPPLDGSHIVYHFLIRGNERLWGLWMFLHQYGFLILWVAILVPPVRALLASAYMVPIQFLLSWVQM